MHYSIIFHYTVLIIAHTLSDFSNKKYLYTTHNGPHDYTVLATAYQLAHQGRRSAKASGHLAETCGM